MPLRPPNLDDRSWQDLMEAAVARIRQTAPDWTDLTPGDPGVVLLDVFAFLTEALIYRLNQVPDKLYIEFLRLIGTQLHPPAAAVTTLLFRRTGDAQGAIEVPAGTRVTLAAAGGASAAPVFVSTRDALLEPGIDTLRVPAVHAEPVDGEPAVLAASGGALRLTVRRPPIIAPSGEPGDLIVGVAAASGELAEGVPARRHEGRDYRLWREVETFADPGPDPHVYVVDRREGMITFSPRARWSRSDGTLDDIVTERLRVPEAGRDIRVWYRCGGGPEGNVAAGTLTVLIDAIAGLEVTNPVPATGGQPGETLDNALLRGPQEFHALHRAVTARDFEALAVRATGEIARACALTKARLWRYARPGTIEVTLVPSVPDASRSMQITADALREVQTERAISRVLEVLDARRPLGTTCEAHWASYKTVNVRAQIAVDRDEESFEVRRRVDERIRATVNPLPVRGELGWPFGQSLYVSTVYKIILSEPGVRYATGVTLVVDETPDVDVDAVAADPVQRGTWYAGGRETLYRSVNDGDGWELMTRFSGETVARIAPHPGRAGLVAATTELPELHSRVWLSRDSASSWELLGQADWRIEDVTWIDVTGDAADERQPILLLATNEGLFRLSTRRGATFQEVAVQPDSPRRGLAAITSTSRLGGEISVAVAFREAGGVWLSTGSSQIGDFRPIGLEGHDVRVLTVQTLGSNDFLWAGIHTAAEEGGCYRRQLLGAQEPAAGWQPRVRNWSGGSCHAIAFVGDTVLAGTHDQGVLWLDSRQEDPVWSTSVLEEERRTLPLRGEDKRLFHPISSLAVDRNGAVVMASGPVGIWRNREGEPSYRADDPRYDNASRKEFDRNVTIPPAWLFVNGTNDIEMVPSDAAARHDREQAGA